MNTPQTLSTRRQMPERSLMRDGHDFLTDAEGRIDSATDDVVDVVGMIEAAMGYNNPMAIRLRYAVKQLRAAREDVSDGASCWIKCGTDMANQGSLNVLRAALVGSAIASGPEAKKALKDSGLLNG
jgi:hypothetical protein